MRDRQLYSVGYGGMLLEELIEQLVKVGVRVLVDVRLNAISRKPGFSKRRFAAALAETGIRYVHDPRLGNPKENRASFQRGDGSEGRAVMRARLQNGSKVALREFVDLVGEEGRVGVLCAERDPARCHRQVVLEMACELDPEIETFDLS